MKYICIQNAGEADVKDMTLLGLSTSRGNAERIGQFGTGFIQGVLVCLRHGITPVVYIGEERVTFHVEGEKDEVVFKYQRKKYRLNVCLGFGEMDWRDPKMGIREFISNAIDAEGWQDHTLSTLTGMKGQAGTTRVFLPYSPFADYVKQIDKLFLHAIGKQEPGVISKPEASPCRIYRKGVFVRELETMSIFDYNLGDDAQIDECRNMSEYMARNHAIYQLRKVSDPALIMRVLNAVIEGRNLLEILHVDNSWRTWDDAWATCWAEGWGETPVCSAALWKFVVKRAPHVIAIQHEDWHKILVNDMGAIDGANLLLAAERKGHEVLPASTAALATVTRVWDKLQRLAFTNGKEKPRVACFRSLMSEDGSDIIGLYDRHRDMVLLREDHDQNEYVALHECIHHITGAEDESYAFSEACLRLAHTIMKRDEGFRYECKNTLTQEG